MKKLILGAFMFIGVIGFSQDNGYFFGGLESNSQWLLDDEDFGFIAPEDQFRSNNYLQLNYNLGKFTAGLQYEAYLPTVLLGYSPTWENQNGIGTYYLNYKNETLDITGGYFYEQFGSGLILRTWEDRQLGINNALKGLRVKFTPTADLAITGVYGQIRNGFDVSEGVIQGLDANLDLSSLMKVDAIDLKLGASYVGRYQSNGANDSIPANINAYGGRLDFVANNFYGGVSTLYGKFENLDLNFGLVANRYFGKHFGNVTGVYFPEIFEHEYYRNNGTKTEFSGFAKVIIKAIFRNIAAPRFSGLYPLKSPFQQDYCRNRRVYRPKKAFFG